MRQRNWLLKKKAHKRDNFTCKKCGFQDKTGAKLEAHHVIPIYLGGKDDLDNLMTLCFYCHRLAPDKKQEFDEYMKEECTGLMTNLIKAWHKVIKENPELVKRIERETKKIKSN